MNFYKVQTGFQIVDSNGVPGTPVDGISTTLTDSVSKIPTDKAVKDAIESAKGEIEDVSISKDVITAYGDLVVGNASGEPDTLHKGTPGHVLTTTQDGLEWKSGISTPSAFVEATNSTPLNLRGNDVLTTANVNIVNTADGYFSVVTDKTASGYASTLSLGTSGFLVNSSSYNTQSSSGPTNISSSSMATFQSAGPLTVSSNQATATFQGAGPTNLQSTGGAPVTVKSNGSSSDHSDLVLTPNAGTLSVNASTADHTLSMFSKSVVEGTTNITDLNLNDSTGASLHSSSAPIRVTSDNAPIYLSSPAGAPIQIVSQTIGGQYGYSLVQTQGTAVNLKGYYTETANSELNLAAYNAKLIQKGDANSYLELQSRNDTANPAVYSDLKLTPTSATISIPTTTSPTSLAVSGDSSISGSAKNITMLASVSSADTGTASFSAGAINGTTTISGSTINIVAAPNGSVGISSAGLQVVLPTTPVTISSTGVRFPVYTRSYDSTKTYDVLARDITDGYLDKISMADAFALGSPITSFGDLMFGGASGVPEALPMGTVGQVLTVGSSGLEWANGGGGGGTAWYCGTFTSANRPATPTEGQYGYDTTIDCVIYYIDGKWKDAAGANV